MPALHWSPVTPPVRVARYDILFKLKISSNKICREIFSVRGTNDVSELLVKYGNERPIADFCKRYIDLNQFCADVMK